MKFQFRGLATNLTSDREAVEPGDQQVRCAPVSEAAGLAAGSAQAVDWCQVARQPQDCEIFGFFQRSWKAGFF